MEYKRDQSVHLPPRLILHGGAGNLSRETITPEKRRTYHAALSDIISRSQAYMAGGYDRKGGGDPSALEIATFTVVLLENNPLFNSSYGAVFTRDGINELDAAVMVSDGLAKRGVGVTGLRRVRNPILLARKMLEHGDQDLDPTPPPLSAATSPDVPSAQGHTLIHGEAAEKLAHLYGLKLVDPSYFFTQNRWDEHIKALEQEQELGTASYSPHKYLPQGTCGAVALDSRGVVCCATSTGGLTNKLTGRIGDTPIVGAGSWAGQWIDDLGDTDAHQSQPLIQLSDALRGLLGDCLPIPQAMQPTYSPIPPGAKGTTTTRSIALSGTGNGDTFVRVAAAHTVAAIAQYRPLSSADALAAVAGRGGLLQQTAGDRWDRTGEGQGGLIGIESVVTRDAAGTVKDVKTTILQNCNCGGMLRAWIDDDGRPQFRIFRDDFD